MHIFNTDDPFLSESEINALLAVYVNHIVNETETPADVQEALEQYEITPEIIEDRVEFVRLFRLCEFLQEKSPEDLDLLKPDYGEAEYALLEDLRFWMMTDDETANWMNELMEEEDQNGED